MILALSPNVETVNKLALSYGCIPMKIERTNSLSDVFKTVRSHVLKEKLASKGDKVVITAGAPFDTKGVKTNMMLVEVI